MSEVSMVSMPRLKFALWSDLREIFALLPMLILGAPAFASYEEVADWLMGITLESCFANAFSRGLV
jgi:hypothetical protein